MTFWWPHGKLDQCLGQIRSIWSTLIWIYFSSVRFKLITIQIKIFWHQVGSNRLNYAQVTWRQGWLPKLPCHMTHTWLITWSFSHVGKKGLPGRARADCGELNDVPSDWVSGFESSKFSLRSGDWTIDSSSRRFISFCFCRLGCLKKKIEEKIYRGGRLDSANYSPEGTVTSSSEATLWQFFALNVQRFSASFFLKSLPIF